MGDFNMKLAKSVIRFLNSNLGYLTKLTIENFKEKCFIYVSTRKSVFSISIANDITVELDDNQDRFNSHFYNQTYKYDSVDEFKVLFTSIVIRVTNKIRKDLNVRYKGREYPVYIELTEIDRNRSMGIEKLYDLNIYNSKGEEQFVAQVSEYPTGSFNVVNIFEGFEIEENDIVRYFNDWIQK